MSFKVASSFPSIHLISPLYGGKRLIPVDRLVVMAIFPHWSSSSLVTLNQATSIAEDLQTPSRLTSLQLQAPAATITRSAAIVDPSTNLTPSALHDPGAYTMESTSLKINLTLPYILARS
ncbi:hypothetical protein OGATHE_006769 [Ogataea polymorpha]|uniref:Uncharacterized protein n=1 Tax=Ogataea polymorpha TaxID=460523 RepID=A0A9P8SXG0_9ASCO|nr:hypothetical protein OGATHE_006769 [Ogataea polymorpha]